MRHVRLDSLIPEAFGDAEGKKCEKRLEKARLTLAKTPAADRAAYLTNYGARKWSPVKKRFSSILGTKCWYTEAESLGADLTIDHYRPKAQYWWLAFDATNFRVACQFSNSPHRNEELGQVGGKGEAFPLLDDATRARYPEDDLFNEQPIVLDPCNESDCELLAFQADGRPVVVPARAEDPIACRRVEESKSLLNLDHPDFNSKRERLYFEIARDVRTHNELPSGSALRNEIRRSLAERIEPTSPFSAAARTYLQFFRENLWVEALLHVDDD